MLTQLRHILTKVKEQTKHSPEIYMNATEGGEPRVEMIRDEVQSEARFVQEIFLNHGHRLSEDQEIWTLGKASLVSRLKVLLQYDRLRLITCPESKLLAEELEAYDLSVDEHANERYGALRVGTQDDLLTALGMAVYKEPKRSVYEDRGLLMF